MLMLSIFLTQNGWFGLSRRRDENWAESVEYSLSYPVYYDQMS